MDGLKVPDGWKLVRVNEHFDDLIIALERAEAKGYLPDAIAESWRVFACDENIVASATPAVEQATKPIAWIRFCGDGLYEGPIMDCDSRRMDEIVRHKPNEWMPLYAIQREVGQQAANTESKRGTSAQIQLERQLTCEAIDGAMAFGYQNTKPPPSADHWLARFWKIGRRQAELEDAVSDIQLNLARSSATATEALTISGHDLSTSAGGRGYIAEFFEKRLRRHDFGRYIAERLAADFACALAAYLHDLDSASSDAKEMT
ncbi:hypothetical protein PMN64_35975 [Bradyrhizobium sp. UFLA01-814]|uniref:hypothetical protein n=1 Tax=Bradyrhizobium sp. UFLA01-814 TaxID=3023480 RepID=UPI00398AFEBE